MSEEWQNIDGYDDYQVSNWGRVKSLKYGKERLLNTPKTWDGYLQVGLYKDGKSKIFKVHRLVANKFIPNPSNLPCINHKDECKTNNHVENLEWCDTNYNDNHGTRNERIADKMTNGKLSKIVCQYTLDGEFIAEYPSTMEVERRLGYSNGNISNCCLGRLKTAYGYIWSYNKEPQSN